MPASPASANRVDTSLNQLPLEFQIQQQQPPPPHLQPSSSSSSSGVLNNPQLQQQLQQQPSNNHFYEPSNFSVTSSQRGGPIYEDIDRMCTYRGCPPDLKPENQQPPSAGQSLQQQQLSDDRVYYNLQNTPSSKRPPSRGSCSQHCGTSSSEVSFESGNSGCSGNSPARQQQQQQQHHVLVNPMSPQHLSRIRAAAGGPLTSPTTSVRSPKLPHSPRSSPNSGLGKPPSSSVYYYSDTLRPRKGGSTGDSDSGISNNRSSEDTPPPPPMLPSSRLALAAAAAAVDPTEQRGRRGKTAGGRGSNKKSPLGSVPV